jgi:hypothetical protein
MKNVLPKKEFRPNRAFQADKPAAAARLAYVFVRDNND